jgi:hypothetical protein
MSASLPYRTKSKLLNYLRFRNTYWKRYTSNMIKFGDECMKFFYAMPIVSSLLDTFLSF